MSMDGQHDDRESANEQGAYDSSAESPTSTEPREVTCEHVVALLGDFVDGALSDRVRQVFATHVEQCAPCLAFLQQYRFASEAVRRCMLKRVPVELETRLLSFLRSRLRGGVQGKSE